MWWIPIIFHSCYWMVILFIISYLRINFCLTGCRLLVLCKYLHITLFYVIATWLRSFLLLGFIFKLFIHVCYFIMLVLFITMWYKGYFIWFLEFLRWRISVKWFCVSGLCVLILLYTINFDNLSPILWFFALLHDFTFSSLVLWPVWTNNLIKVLLLF